MRVEQKLQKWYKKIIMTFKKQLASIHPWSHLEKAIDKTIGQYILKYIWILCLVKYSLLINNLYDFHLLIKSLYLHTHTNINVYMQAHMPSTYDNTPLYYIFNIHTCICLFSSHQTCIHTYMQSYVVLSHQQIQYIFYMKQSTLAQ